MMYLRPLETRAPSHISFMFVTFSAKQWQIQGGGRRPQLWPKIFSISCSFWKILQNDMLAPPLEGWCPLLWGILDPSLPNLANNIQVRKSTNVNSSPGADPGFPRRRQQPLILEQVSTENCMKMKEIGLGES